MPGAGRGRGRARGRDRALTALVAAAVALGALAQSVSGIGFVLVCGPLLVAALGPYDGVRLAVVLSVLVNLVVLAGDLPRVRWRDAGLLLLPAALATPVLAVLVRAAPTRVAAALAGAVALGGALALAVGLRWRRAAGRAGLVAAGVLSAATNVAAAIGGPPVVLWTANAGWPADTARATLQAYFLGLNAVALASLGLPRVPGALLVACVAALAAGLAAGRHVAGRVAEPLARRATLALAGAGGAVVLVRAALG